MRVLILIGAAVLLSGCTSIGALSTAPAIREKARGVAKKRLAEFAAIDASNGIDQAEAFAMAEWQILGAVDSRRILVRAYGQPKLVGDEWQIDVQLRGIDGIEHRPIYIDALTGYSHGEGWDNFSEHSTSVGQSTYQLKRKNDSVTLEVILSDWWKSGDTEAKAACLRDAKAALAAVQRALPGRFKAAPESAIKLSEVKWYDVYPDRQWRASVPLEWEESRKRSEETRAF